MFSNGNVVSDSTTIVPTTSHTNQPHLWQPTATCGMYQQTPYLSQPLTATCGMYQQHHTLTNHTFDSRQPPALCTNKDHTLTNHTTDSHLRYVPTTPHINDINQPHHWQPTVTYCMYQQTAHIIQPHHWQPTTTCCMYQQTPYINQPHHWQPPVICTNKHHTLTTLTNHTTDSQQPLAVCTSKQHTLSNHTTDSHLWYVPTNTMH